MTARELDAARGELAEAVRVVELLDVDDPAPAGDVVAIMRGIIERDLAARRVEAWDRIVARLARPVSWSDRPPLWEWLSDDRTVDAAVTEDDVPGGGGLVLYVNDGGDAAAAVLDQAAALALLDALETWRGRHAL